MAVFKKSNLYCLLIGTYNPFILIEITDIFGFVIYFVFLFLFLFIARFSAFFYLLICCFRRTYSFLALCFFVSPLVHTQYTSCPQMQVGFTPEKWNISCHIRKGCHNYQQLQPSSVSQ
ncbi:unnamed protein product [Rangifer tarandus platyrhynchus]|uniref:Uncharacterized protein n=1 Tax=Rangifer tarandus platyrhynchus TaxID=3082113 RepID=A0AC59ZYX7_RANTA